MTMKSSFCDCSDDNIIVKGNITITGVGADATVKKADKRKKQVTLKNFTSLTDCISETSNSQADNAEYLDGVSPMYNIIE